MTVRLAIPLLLTALLAACGDEPLLHDLGERQANEVLVALDEEGLAATKLRQEGSEAAWTVSVARGEAGKAHRLLAERQLPRARPQGLGEVFAQAGMVPTPVEERARWLHALSGELARSVEALDGVVEARVHLGLPADDPLRPGARSAPRAAVLVKCRPASCASLRELEPGLRSLVAGAAEGLVPEAVAVVIAEAAPVRSLVSAKPRRLAPWLAGLAAVGACAVGWLAWQEWRRDRRRAGEAV
jgi:type III secretion protein J